MYRQFLPVFLYITAVSSAPQDNSEITYVKIQPVTAEPKTTQSRIDTLPTEANNTEKETDLKEESSLDVTVHYDDVETTTFSERDETLEELIQETDEYESRTKAPSPRFLSKLSYFQKPDVVSSVSTNLVERTGKRKFKSKCRCEKIWNCPKLQITVPRCPNEYFLCCF